jgi:hypothetical protein
LVSALAALIAIAVAAGPAAASLWVVLDPAAAPAGARISGRTGGEAAFSTQLEPLPAYLVARSAADFVTARDDARLVSIGELVVDAARNGTIEFTVPAIAPGGYALVLWCPSCAPTSGGRSMVWVADFTVTATPATDTVSMLPRPTRADPLRVLAAALVLTALLIAVRRLSGSAAAGSADRQDGSRGSSSTG